MAISSYFSNPSFGIDNSGLAFGGSTLGSSSFGSIPTYTDNASSLQPLSLAKPGMDPFSIGLGVAGIGSSIFGAFSQRDAAREQARATEEAAREQADAVKQASETGARLQLAQAGLNYLENRYKGGPGGALDRINATRDYVQRANIEANNPSVRALRSVQTYENRLQRAMPGYIPPDALFV